VMGASEGTRSSYVGPNPIVFRYNRSPEQFTACTLPGLLHAPSANRAGERYRPPSRKSPAVGAAGLKVAPVR
jgi:hypothetical protein